MYAQAIKMNAENKINATNTWSLQLIDNMDAIIALALPSPSKANSSSSAPSSSSDSSLPAFAQRSDHSESASLVNFQKASCTLDASVKIYGYRVDDVHSTGYKVLANLNRTDGGDDSDKEDGGENDEDGEKRKAKKRANRNVQTLESNYKNLNMSR